MRCLGKGGGVILYLAVLVNRKEFKHTQEPTASESLILIETSFPSTYSDLLFLALLQS